MIRDTPHGPNRRPNRDLSRTQVGCSAANRLRISVKPSAAKNQSATAAAARLIARTAADIDAARVYDVASVTALEFAPKLSARLGNRVLMKREDQQSVYSFKLRGAYNKMARMSAQQRARGVICASAGNHAQGVALAARQLGCPAWIVMPRTTPQIKVDAVRLLGGRAVLFGDAYDDAAAHALELAAQKGLTMVPPYDDADVIAGQGTVAKEILEQIGEGALDAVFVCTGGGGLLAGVAAYIKQNRPGIKVISVEPDDSDCMAQALEAGRRIKLERVGLFADGVAVRQAGALPFRIARETVDAALRVSIDELCAATRDVFQENRSLPEPAGALGVAGVKRWVAEHGMMGQTFVAIISGANLNFDRLRHIAERAELGDGHETLLAVTIAEKPGSFRQFLKSLGRHPITEFNYRYATPEHAHVFAGIKFSDAKERDETIAGLRQGGLEVTDLTGDEMAKVHIRYMVGGRAPGVLDERLFRFEFPERPGACLEFLSAIGERWNISLFHYRNHGAAYGRVLCGLQVPKSALSDCRRTLDALGYQYWDETTNPAYALFLGAQA